MFKFNFKINKDKSALKTEDESRVKLLSDVDEPEKKGVPTKQVEMIRFTKKVEPTEEDEKAQMVAQIMERRKTLSELFKKAAGAKEDIVRLRSENEVLTDYMEKLMAASSAFQPLKK